MNRGARNSVAAQDWALKRKQQMERAARIKAEEEAAAAGRLGADRLQASILRPDAHAQRGMGAGLALGCSASRARPPGPSLCT